MLELAGLEVRYGSVPAVRGLSLRLDEGEIVGLIGPNGAGKSTTLHAVMGLVPVYDGEVTLTGMSLKGRAPEWIARPSQASHMCALSHPSILRAYPGECCRGRA